MADHIVSPLAASDLFAARSRLLGTAAWTLGATKPIACEGLPTKEAQTSAAVQEANPSAQPFPALDRDLNEGWTRYIPYVARAKMLLIRAKVALGGGIRYVAYSSDVGESLRPVIKPWQVNLTYGLAGAYVLGDVAITGYRAHKNGCSQDAINAACVHTATFQGLASLLLPAVTIHTIVHQVQHVLEKPSMARLPVSLRMYGPSGVGLVVIPFLPLMDPPCEMVLDAVFDKVWPAWREAHDHHHAE